LTQSPGTSTRIREDTACRDDGLTSKVGMPPVARSFAMLLLASTSIFAYHFAFQLSKPSPLSFSPPSSLATVSAYVLLVALAGATIIWPLALAGDALGRRWLGQPGVPIGSTTVCAGLYALGLLAVVENFVYILTGLGLRTSDSLWPRVTLGTLAVLAGVLLARMTAKLSSRRTRLLRTCILAMCIPAFAAVAYDKWTSESPPTARVEGLSPFNVIILSADGIESEHMTIYGYERNTTPFLSSRAGEFQIFNNAYANSGKTTGSITSMLTGRSPAATGVIMAPDPLPENKALRSLPYLLGKAGYHRSNWAVPHYADGRAQNLIDAFDIDNGYRAAESPLGRIPLGTGPARWFVTETVEGTVHMMADLLGLRELDDPYAAVRRQTASARADRARLESVLKEIRTESRFFINTHFMAPHGPWFDVETPHFSRSRTQSGPWLLDFYDDAVRQFDNYTAQVYRELERSGKLNETLLIVTSDHGIGHIAKKRIPLLIRFPNRAHAGRVDLNVQRLDLAPTIIDYLGLPQPTWMTGPSLLDLAQIPDDRQIFALTTADQPYNEVIVTAIRCNNYFELYPSGDIERGTVDGSTVRCRHQPSESSLRELQTLVHGSRK
jgi:arylsulfatase A-like enzyme